MTVYLLTKYNLFSAPYNTGTKIPFAQQYKVLDSGIEISHQIAFYRQLLCKTDMKMIPGNNFQYLDNLEYANATELWNSKVVAILRMTSKPHLPKPN